MHTPQRDRWSRASDLVTSFSRRTQTSSEKLAILNSVWEKECGAFANHWSLVAVSKGTLYIRPKSSAAGQELQLRGVVLLKSLNKYFSRPWLTNVRTTYR